jgi:hypothetical protein
MRTGEAISALHHPAVGDIDLVWGEVGTGKSDGYGLAKLVKYHPEVLDDLQGILSNMRVLPTKSKNRINLKSETHRATVRLTWNEQTKRWLLTAFEKKDGMTGTRTDTANTQVTGDTARRDNAVDQTVAPFAEKSKVDGRVSRETDSPVAQTAKKDAPPEETILGKPAGQYSDATLQKFARQKGPGGEKAQRELARRQAQAGVAPASSPETFIPAPDGSRDYGAITPEQGKAMKRQAGPIRLQQGVQNADGTGWGLVHIEARHGKQIRALVFIRVN